MRTRTTGLSLLLLSALTLSACSTNDAAEPAEPPAESAESAEEAPESAIEESESPEAPAPGEAGEPMTPEDFEAGGSELAGQTMQQWLLAEGEVPEDTQNLLYELTEQVIYDPTIEWLDEGREHAGQASELVPFAYPAFDSYTPNFRSEEAGQHFQAVALRVDHASMMDLITGMSYATELEDSPTTPGLLMSASDENYYYLVGLLDLTQVDRDGDVNEWRQDYVSEIFAPIDVWRTSVEQES